MTQLGAALWTSRFLLPRREKRGCLPTRTGQHLRSGIRHTDGFSHSKGNACYYQIRAPRYLEMNLSDSDKEALRGFRDAVPYSRDRLRKGDLGRICIIGGSEEYTGAPYFVGLSALRAGADLAHIVCSKDSAAAIKVQLEDTSRAVIDIVRSSGRDKPALGDKELEEKMTAAVERTLEVAYRCNVVVVGPGLSRDGTMQSLASRIILPLAAQNKPIIIDGDGIQILIERRDVIKPGKNIYATPNLNEFKRLWKSFMVPCVFDFHARPSILTASPCKPDSDNYPEGIDDFGAATRVIASRLGAMVVLKSEEDIVSDGRTSVLVGSYGCRKRCGGQGDLLCGIMSVLIAWKDIHMRSMIDDGELERKMKFYACQCALHIMKTAAEDTYKHFGYGMIAGDIIPNIHRATMNILVNKNLH